MMVHTPVRGAAPVGHLSDLNPASAAAVLYFRLWQTGSTTRAKVGDDFIAGLGPNAGQRAFDTFAELCDMLARYGRRPFVAHSIGCKCLGGDEACLAHFIDCAATGDREEAMLIATLMVRVDITPMLVAHAANVGLAIKRMGLSAPRHLVRAIQTTASPHLH